MQSLLTVNNSVTLLSVNIAPSSFIAAFTLGLVFLYIYLISVARVPSPLPVLRALGSLPGRLLPSSKDSDELTAPPGYSLDEYDPFNANQPYHYRSSPLQLQHRPQHLLGAPPSPSTSTVLTRPYYLQQGGFSSDLHLATQLTQIAQRRTATPILNASPPEKQKRKHSSSSAVSSSPRNPDRERDHDRNRDRDYNSGNSHSRPSSERKSSFFRSRDRGRDRDRDRDSEREKPLPRLRQAAPGPLDGTVLARSLPAAPPTPSPTRSSAGARIAAGLGLSPDRSSGRRKHHRSISIYEKDHARDDVFASSSSTSGSSKDAEKSSSRSSAAKRHRDPSPHGFGRRLFGRGWPALESPKKRQTSRVSG
ncbi:hypothetical protein BROUX41_000697 [Berkeleyomyces rouxiae]|uniref:uncharacterized protein n=1 Tax=Berkeleyomyces rouxiae TaxID=2035830 RepID=UPI003B7C2A4B